MEVFLVHRSIFTLLSFVRFVLGNFIRIAIFTPNKTLLCPWYMKINYQVDMIQFMELSPYILVSTISFLRVILKLFWFKNTRTKHYLTVFQKILRPIPNDHMPSQKDPKTSIDWRCSLILPWCQPVLSSEWFLRSVHSSFQLQKLDWPNSVKIWRNRTCLFLNMFLSEVIPL